jgi:hypothetical protein
MNVNQLKTAVVLAWDTRASGRDSRDGRGKYGNKRDELDHLGGL